MIDALKSQRSQLSSRLSDVMTARARLRQAEGEEASILAAIGDLSKDEIDALRAWVRTGEGPKPEPDIETRRDLHDRLVKAQAAAENAKGVHVDLDDEERDLTKQLSDVNARIETIAWDQLQAEHRQAVDDLSEWFASAVRPRVAHIVGLRSLLTQLAQAHQASGRGDAAMDLFRRGERVGEVRPDAEVNLLPAEALKAASDWKARLDDLISDAPSNVVRIGDAA